MNMLTGQQPASIICGAMDLRTWVGIALCSTLSFFGHSAEQPPQTRYISLRECLEMALTRNLDLQIDQASIQIAGYSLSGAVGKYYSPILSLSARRDFEDAPGDFAPQKENPDFPYQLTRDTVQAGLSGNAPLGLQYDVSTLGGHNDAATDFNGMPDKAAEFYWGVRETNNFFADTRFTARQHLLRDFWIDQDRLNLKLLRKDLKMTQYALRFRAAQTILAVELAYYDLIVAREQIAVEEKSVELQKKLVEETRRRIALGDLPPLDAEQVETQLQNTMMGVLKARESEASLQNLLKSLVIDNFRDWVDTEIVPLDTLIALPPEGNRSEAFQRALRSRPDLAEARVNVEKSAVTVQFRQNQLFPSLDLIGQYGGLGVNPNLAPAVHQAARFDNPTYYYGVVMSYPIGSISERNAYRASKTSREVAELQLKRAEESVLVQVADWSSRVQSRYQQITYARSARAYAERALEAELKKLNSGLSTSFVVLQLEDILRRARAAEIQALADYNKALAQLAFSQGASLERNNLALNLSP